MWILRFLSGPLAGQIFPIKKNSTLIGRSPACDLKIPSPGISKEHTRVEIFEDKLLFTDAGSRNGTFLNGVQIRSAKVRSGDRIALHDVIVEVQNVPDQWAQAGYPQYGWPQQGGYPPGYPPSAYNGNAAYQYAQVPGAAGPAMPEQPQSAARGWSQRLPLWVNKAQTYIDKEVLPGVYKIPELFEFKWVLAGFMFLFILLVTSLSTVPLIRILKNSVEQQSQQHALTIATTLARVNRQALKDGMDTAVTVDIAMSRPGVKTALVISNIDGNIIAPASQAGTFPDLPYIHEARKLSKESVKQIDDNTVAAVVPIDFYDPDTGTQTVKADAVVFYDMASIAVDSSEILGLFISTLFIALLVGSILFYFLYKVVEYPFNSLNQQLDSALKEGHDTVQVTYRFPALTTLANNVGSALTRALNGSDNVGKVVEHDRNREITNLVELIGFAAVGIRAHDLSIAAINHAWESRTSITAAQAMQMTVNDVSDQALKLSMKDLIERVDQKPDDMATNELEFAGQDFNVVAQAVYGASKIAYYLIVLLPTGEGE